MKMVVVKLFKLLLIFPAVLVNVPNALKVSGEVLRLGETLNNLHKLPRPLPSAGSDVKLLRIAQKLDHFNKYETRIWTMRFAANDKFYKPGGPMFIFVGGGKIMPGFIEQGHFYDMAREHNAYLFYTEHRFSGGSRPVAEMTNENLKYLDVQQTLADLRHFIHTMKATIPGMENSKVILAGGSYGGTLVTWFKKLYPAEAAGCWASSAPLEANFDFVEYKEITGESIRLVGGKSCYHLIKSGIQQLENMMEDNRIAELEASLSICDNFNNTNVLDVWSLSSYISALFSNIVQHHRYNDIENACHQMLNEVDKFKGFTNFIVNSMGKESCTDYTYETSLNLFYKETSFKDDSERSWLYQRCNEFGWFQTTDSTRQPFGSKVPIKLFTTLCKDAFGDKFTPQYIRSQVQITNKRFGGLNPKVENVYMTQGELDPWRGAGIQEKGEATLIPMVSHCADFESISASDSIQLRASKIKISKLIENWLVN